MVHPEELYEVRDETWELMAGHRPVLIVQLDGFVDAGRAGRLFSKHLLGHLDHRVLAEFDYDELHDYRSRRPMMTFETDHWAAWKLRRLRLHRLTDENGEAFLLLNGPEPDMHWERACDAILGLIADLDVRLTVSLFGIPGGVPHTRPVPLNAHGTDTDLVPNAPGWFSTMEVQGSFAAMLEYRLGEQGGKAVGFEAFVPHYLSQAEYPQATLVLGQRIAQATGLGVPMTPLESAAASNLDEIAEEVKGSTEAQEMIAQLESHYDSLRAEHGNIAAPAAGASDEVSVPTADEIGAAFERFLAERERGRRGQPPTGRRQDEATGDDPGDDPDDIGESGPGS
jgi:hypothetical protein